ncbi:Uncharacterised protein [Neisseria gonorrhoeae]|uniref:Uncharacterized protein n=1 Tax=Neisseria gonorrhoeae TaxID=485 RepID=A0A378VSS5_NEIGO|nr:Uncharacterised protein [Neisseria gonorrhoeae]
MRTDVSEIIAYRAYFAFVCAGCIGIIAGNVFVGVSQIRLHIRAAVMVFTRRLRCGREEKFFGAGFIFRLRNLMLTD